MADYRGIDINEYAENGLNDVSGLLSRREYKRGIIKARQVAERIVRSYASERNIEYTTFADTIEQLYAAKLINMQTRDAFHTIRIYGNKVVHEADDNSSDAENAYRLLKNEIQTYMSRRNVSIDRTPVRVERGQQPSYKAYERDGADYDEDAYEAGRSYGRRGSYGDEYDSDDRETQMPVRGRREQGRGRDDERRRDRNTKSGRSSAKSGSGRRDDYDEEKRGGIGIYDILKVLIPVVVVILIVIIIKSLIPSKPAVTETTTVVETTAETTTAPETTIEETTEPETTETETEAPITYRIKGDGINIRYADNQERIYTQLSDGTAIGEVTPLEGTDFVQFTLDGVNVVVRKDLIEPVQ